MDTKSLEEQALRLPPTERARLAQELLESLETLSPAEIEALWVEEAEHRAREIDSGAVALVSSAEVERKARALFR
jgi:hypothetical protein